MTTTLAIWVIDDDDNDVALLRSACQTLGEPYGLTHHATGETALEALRRTAAQGRLPDVILLDMDLPGLAGYEILRLIRSDPRLQPLVVVMWTGSVAPEDREISALADHYEVKPQEPGDWKPMARRLAAYAHRGRQAARAPDAPAAAMEPHILHIDDDEDDRNLFALAFARSGLAGVLHSVAGTADALLYLNQLGPYIHALRPRLIILDLSLPRVDGRELLMLLRSNSRFKTIPVLVLTGSENYADMQRCRELGVNDYLVKPQTAQELIELIASFDHWLESSETNSPIP